ncbi:hypothetical protein Ciccas_014383 [Cichlidogyrus casuarinus]|uniref:Receptor L-domain domain-containing protein n=1 Tax=Cichlidogyrus casuarinus TaxID=1844966 RepID=A0ABD2PIB9_9PLAT
MTKCVTVVGDLVLRPQEMERKDLDNFLSIKKVYGLVDLHLEADGDLAFLRNLESIISKHEDRPALKITTQGPGRYLGLRSLRWINGPVELDFQHPVCYSSALSHLTRGLYPGDSELCSEYTATVGTQICT